MDFSQFNKKLSVFQGEIMAGRWQCNRMFLQYKYFVLFSVCLLSWSEDGQFLQSVLTNVERGETDADGDRTFDPVHRQTFVQSTDDPFRPKRRRGFCFCKIFTFTNCEEINPTCRRSEWCLESYRTGNCSRWVLKFAFVASRYPADRKLSVREGRLVLQRAISPVDWVPIFH